MSNDEVDEPTPADSSATPAESPARRQATGTATDESAARREAAGTATATSEAPRRAAPRRRFVGRWRQVLLTLLIGALVVTLGIAGLNYLHARQAVSGVHRSALLPTDKNRPKPPDGPMTFLIMGADTRDYDPTDPGRSDTMMLAYVPKDRKHVYLVSITRDLWVPIHDGGYAKINQAYADGGAALTVQTLEDLFGMGINHVALMDFQGFMKMTDAVGGVQVWNETEFEDSADMGCHFPVGWVTVQGDCGLAFVRERKNSPNNDLGRAQRQRDVIKAISAKALQQGVLSNPAVSHKLMDQMASNFTLDDQMSDQQLLDFTNSLKIGSSQDIRSLQLPIGGYDRSADGQDINVPDNEQLAELAAAMRSDTMDRWWETHDPTITMTDNPAWPVEQGMAPYGTPSPRPKVPLPTARPTATRNTKSPGAATSSKK